MDNPARSYEGRHQLCSHDVNWLRQGTLEPNVSMKANYVPLRNNLEFSISKLQYVAQSKNNMPSRRW